MLTKLKSIINRFSENQKRYREFDWMESLEGNVSSCSNFEEICHQEKCKPIYHVTDMDAARSIIFNKYIFGIDTVSAAHFHHSPVAAFDQARKSDCVLGFSWSGEIRDTASNERYFSHADQSPNVLFEAHQTAASSEIWEYRIYPKTDSFLCLRYIQIGAKCTILASPINMVVKSMY